MLLVGRQESIWPGWFCCHSLSLTSVKSRLVLPFWYQLTRVVPDKGLLNGCVGGGSYNLNLANQFIDYSEMKLTELCSNN